MTKNTLNFILFCFLSITSLHAYETSIKADEFDGWKLRADPYSASGQVLGKGGKVATCLREVIIPETKVYYIWIRYSGQWKISIKKWKSSRNIRDFKLFLNDNEIVINKGSGDKFVWYSFPIKLAKGSLKVKLEKIGHDPYFDIMIITDKKTYKPKTLSSEIIKENSVSQKRTVAASVKKKSKKVLEPTLKNSSIQCIKANDFSGWNLRADPYSASGQVLGKGGPTALCLREITIPKTNVYYIWIRYSGMWKIAMKKWKSSRNIRDFKLFLNDNEIVINKGSGDKFVWYSFPVELTKGPLEVKLEKIGGDPYFDILYIADNSSFKPKKLNSEIIKEKFLKQEFSVPVIPIVKEKPIIDGNPNDKVWQKATIFKDFLTYGIYKKTNSTVDTEIRVLTDNRYLFFKVSCKEPDMKNLVNQKEKRDGNLWNGCNIEIFIDGNNDKSTYYQICVDQNGNIFDAYLKSKAWNSKTLKVKTFKTKSAWGFEMSIDILELGYGITEVTATEKKMAMNFVRNRKLSSMKKTEISSWAHWPDFGLHQPDKFIPVILKTEAKGSVVSFRNMEYVPEKADLVYLVANPLFKELLSSEPRYDKTKYGGYVSTFGLNDMELGKKNSVAVALQHGLPYDQDDILDLYQEYGLTFKPESAKAVVGNIFTDKKLKAKARKRGLRGFMNWHLKFGGQSWHYRGVKNPGTPPSLGLQNFPLWPIDDRVVNGAVLYANNLIEHIDCFGYMIGHEETWRSVYYYEDIRKIYLKYDPKTWQRYDAEVKSKYGQGKWGMPKTANDGPLQNIAYLKWFTEKYQKNIRKLVKAIKNKDAKAEIYSDINYGGFFPYGYERMSDIYTATAMQLVPTGDPLIPRSAAMVKFFKDVYKTDVWPCSHIEHYFFTFSPQEVNQIFSDMIRNGATGFFQWMYDWFGLTYSDYYGSPERTEACLNIFAYLKTGKKLNYPKAETAVFYCNIDEYAKHGTKWGSSTGKEYLIAYALIGARTKSWFNYISDYNLLENADQLEKYKVVYVPSADYIDDITFNKFTKYVKNGGIVVLNSPDAFRYSDIGKKRDKFMKKFTGISSYTTMKIPQKMKITDKALLKYNNNEPFSVKLNNQTSGSCYKIKIKEAVVLGTFNNNAPALVRNSYGKGTVITFATTPYTDDAYRNNEQWKLFDSFQQLFGCSVNEKIWRFRIPEDYKKVKKIWDYEWPSKLVCFTGNAGRWKDDKPIKGPNKIVNGTYSYSLAPDLVIEEKNKTKNITFKEGVLLNRIKSLYAASVHRSKRKESLKNQMDGWAVAWEKTGEVRIDFKFQKKINANKCALFVYGSIPDISLFSGRQKLGVVKSPGVFNKTKVSKITINFNSKTTDSFSILIGKRSAGPFYLSEVEFWGKE